MMPPKRTKVEMPCLCPTCGNKTKSFVLTNEKGSIIELGKCGKCSNESYPMSFFNVWWIVEKIVSENIGLRNRVFDLECYVEEQVNPIGGEM